ncbi:hypothetical protein HFO88_30120 [Rhizobium leguminosarum]|uniref:hypothetical protein n=1 Tax=Rhizobium leguminosarum TaxID=384 RepID=UPI001C9753BA|nr:hypothetical protein [Rhizobium leguminosarum]MBY5904553.1 hypothetical protein [Rhizobium leguminosarum]MBY5911644.1 hypothetical protein [Rhizobium leguminosarum]
MTPAICVAFTAGAAFKFKQLEDLLSEHLKDNGGILPHLLMADYCRLVERAPDDEWVGSFLAYLEDNFSGQSESLTELISVSFIEHLLPDESLCGPVVKLLGKRMREEHRHIFGIE